jgi:D-alanyl-D-alanine dipeptidase
MNRNPPEIEVDQTDDELRALFGDERLAKAASRGKLTQESMQDGEDELSDLGLGSDFFSAAAKPAASPSQLRRRRARRLMEKATRAAQRPKKKKGRRKK